MSNTVCNPPVEAQTIVVAVVVIGFLIEHLYFTQGQMEEGMLEILG